jgi:hypothetical protein
MSARQSKKDFWISVLVIIICLIGWISCPNSDAKIFEVENSFEDYELGEEPTGWIIEKEGDDITVEITDVKATDGSKSLLIENQAEGSYLKNMLIPLPVEISEGSVMFTYDFFSEGASTDLSLSDAGTPGAYFLVGETKLRVMQGGAPVDVVQYTSGNWYRLTVKVDDIASKQFRIKFEQLLNGEVQSVLYDDLKLWDFNTYAWGGAKLFDTIRLYQRSSQKKSKLYIDNIKLITYYEETINPNSKVEMYQDKNNDGTLEPIEVAGAKANDQPVVVKVTLSNIDGMPLSNVALNLVSSRNDSGEIIDLIQPVDRDLEDDYGPGVTDLSGVAYFTVTTTQGTMGFPAILTITGIGVDGELIHTIDFKK